MIRIDGLQPLLVAQGFCVPIPSSFSVAFTPQPPASALTYMVFPLFPRLNVSVASRVLAKSPQKESVWPSLAFELVSFGFISFICGPIIYCTGRGSGSVLRKSYGTQTPSGPRVGHINVSLAKPTGVPGAG